MTLSCSDVKLREFFDAYPLLFRTGRGRLRMERFLCNLRVFVVIFWQCLLHLWLLIIGQDGDRWYITGGAGLICNPPAGYTEGSIFQPIAMNCRKFITCFRNIPIRPTVYGGDGVAITVADNQKTGSQPCHIFVQEKPCALPRCPFSPCPGSR